MSDTTFTFSDDGLTLLSCESDAESVVVPEGCQAIGTKAFMYMENLKSVHLPSTLQSIGDYAFACTGLESFVAPPHLNYLGAKAFFRCQNLEKMVLNEGLETIANEAFTSCTSLRVLTVPSTVTYFGHNATYGTPLVFEGYDATFQLAPGNRTLVLDGAGAIYQRNPNGSLTLTEMLSRRVREHQVLPGTESIASFAYLGNTTIEKVSLPEGLLAIQESAFRKCTSLHQVDVPSSLVYIGDHAFFQTSLRSFDIPSGLEYLGIHGLITGDQEYGSTLSKVTLGPGNLRFFIESDILCEWNDDGTAFAVTFFGNQPQVRVPDPAVSIGPYCFSTVTGVEEITLHKNVNYIHPCGFPAYNRIPTLRIELEEPECGRDYVLLRNVNRATFLNSNLYGKFSVAKLCAQSDRDLLTVTNVYPRALRMMERLECPQFLEESVKQIMERNLERNAEEAIIAFALHGYLAGVERMVNCGALNADNITQIIDVVRDRGFTAMTACLLECKRAHFNKTRRQTDFSL